MENKEIWNKFIVGEYNSNICELETVIQAKWEEYFSELFDYKKILGEILVHPKLRVGSVNVVYPDIIIAKENENLMAIELKQYNIPFSTKIEEQIKSYMSLLHLSIGIIVCSEIYIYVYDNKNNTYNSVKIPFEIDNSDGVKFVELIKKDNFSIDKISAFVNGKKDFEKHIKEIKDKIDKNYLENLLKNNLKQEYSDEEIERVLKTINIEINPVGTVPDVNNYRHTKTYVNSSQTYKSSNIVELSEKTGIMNKRMAVSLFAEKGFDLYNVTYSSKNSSARFYWANPRIDVLNVNWSLILNDSLNKKLYLFEIPQNSINLSDLVVRSDNHYLIDLQIIYNSDNFTDSRSGYNFISFLKCTVTY